MQKARLGSLFTKHTAGVRINRAYSRFVRLMRIFLPLVAFAIIAIVFAWPRMEKPVTTEQQKQNMAGAAVARNELIAPRFESTDAKNRPFTVTAARAVQSAQDPDSVILEKPEGEIMLSGGAKLSARAERGQYRQTAEKLLLEGDVKFSHTDGFMFQTEKIMADLKAQKAWTDQPVSGRGESGTVVATGLQYDGAAGTLVLTGPATLTLTEKLKGL